MSDEQTRTLLSRQQPAAVLRPALDRPLPSAADLRAGKGGSECETVRKEIAAGAYSGQAYASCAERRPYDPKSVAGAAPLRAGPAVAPAPLATTASWTLLDSAPTIPNWCDITLAHPPGIKTRLRECHLDGILEIIFDTKTAEVVGMATVSYVEWEVLSNKLRSWTHEIRVHVDSQTGAASAGVYLNGRGGCGFGFCTVTQTDGTTFIRLSSGRWLSGSWPMSNLGGPNQATDTNKALTEFNFLNLAAGANGEATTWSELAYESRCDSTLPNTPKEGGCVFYKVIPELALDKSSSSKYQQHALFVEAAQLSTPDHYGGTSDG
jgi:hypothetical protein